MPNYRWILILVLFSINNTYGLALRVIGEIRLGVDIDSVTLVLQSSSHFANVRIIAAEPNKKFFTATIKSDSTQAFTFLYSIDLFEYVEVDRTGHSATVDTFIPNDEFFNLQWSHYNDGSATSPPSKYDADADILEAWTLSQGKENIVVAILDSGVKITHPELINRLWINTREVADNNIDDDNNGYIDDVNGWNMVTGSSDIEDDAGHGTHIAGIIGANGNNNIGYAGVDWNCKLMICKVLDINEEGFYSYWIEAIHYAVDNGAKIINMSLGGAEYSTALKSAIAYAAKNNVLVVASMQNTNSSKIFYPAGFDEVLAVGSTDPDDSRSTSFGGTTFGSNFGSHLDVVAPGNYIYGLSNMQDTSYGRVLSGTSQAAALVSGIASLLLATDNQLSSSQIRSIICNSAEDLIGNPSEDIPGWDIYYGYGRVNALNALLGKQVFGFKSNFRIYPNPSEGILQVSIDQEQGHDATLEIYNLLNEKVFVKNWVSERIVNETFNFSDFKPGIYIVVFRNTKQKFVVKWSKIR